MMGALVVNGLRNNNQIQSLIFRLDWYLRGDMTLSQTKVKVISAKHDAFNADYLGVTKDFTNVFKDVARPPAKA